MLGVPLSAADPKVGRTYRWRDLQHQYGGQQQGGIPLRAGIRPSSSSSRRRASTTATGTAGLFRYSGGHEVRGCRTKVRMRVLRIAPRAGSIA